MIAPVIDASVALKWVAYEAGSELARALSRASMHAPDLLFLECANALWRKARTGELTKEEAVDGLALIEAAGVRLTRLAELASEALQLSIRLQHPVYDCSYLALAVRLGSKVITDDRRFVRAVQRDATLARHIQPLS